MTVGDESRLRDRRAADPLVDHRSASSHALRYAAVFVAAVGLHAGLFGGVGFFVSGEDPTTESDGTVEVEILDRSSPSPEPPEREEPVAPTTVPKPEPSPEPGPDDASPDDSQPESAERQPQPDPPSRESPPDPEESDDPDPAEPGEEEPEKSEAASREPVELTDFEMESTAEGGDGPKFKVADEVSEGTADGEPGGAGRRGDAEQGGGEGAGGEGGETTGVGESGASGADCEPSEAEVRNRVRADGDEYPIGAKRRGIEGEVVAVLQVDANGDVTAVDIKKSLGHGLDELARETFQKWTFSPARENCQPVATSVRVTYEFRLR